ncbi:MAG: FtsX-like permease family protein [Planctomycetota bacterium]
MATPLSIHNLIHGGWRTVLSIVGISIAIVLIFMQLGFLGAVTDTAVVFYDEMEFDLIACSPDYYNFVDSGRFSRDHLNTIASNPGVQSVKPLHVSLGKWNYEEKEVQRGMLIIGVDPDQPIFRDDSINQKLNSLTDHHSILVDQSSRPRFLGADNKTKFDERQIGLEIELNGVTCTLANLFEIGTGLAADGASIVNENHFTRMIPGYGQRSVALGLIRAESGVSIEDLRTRIESTLPPSDATHGHPVVRLLTRRELAARETAYWQWGTPIGFIFLAGAIVAFLVGAIIVYIVLSSDISKQISEYATLKAMGYRNQFLAKTVLEQSFILAIASYLSALVVSLVLYQVVGNAAKLPITMTWTRLVIVFFSSLIMSFVSALIAMQKLRQADPADLF